jgi:eukaryotic-like serine/threonine-protein kinase
LLVGGAGASSLTGRQLGRFRIGPLLATGGMGEVYRALDTRLGRDVAIKILPADVTTDAERLARFDREARALALLNHPNIAAIYGIEESQGLYGLVLELVEGETLAATIARGPVSAERFFDIAVALADALAAAHEKGITHRDLKPANVMLRPDGRVKVLDFGIAKLRAEPDAAQRETTLTRTGELLGTVAYMSPEQAEGRAADHRSDIFSLGTLLHELATGTHPFAGDSAFARLVAIVNATPPPVGSWRPDLPPELDRVLGRALQKEPARRYASAAELRDELEALRPARTPVLVTPAILRRRRARLAAILAGPTVALALAAVVLRWGEPPTPISVTDVTQLTWEQGVESAPDVSPDGSWLAYEHGGSVYLRSVGGSVPVQLTTDSRDWDGQPAFSPDGRQIAFASRREGGETVGGIWLIEVTGGTARRLTRAGFSPAWSPDGREIVHATEPGRMAGTVRISTLHAIDVRSGTTRLVSDVDATEPAWSPNGHRIAYSAFFSADARPEEFDIWTVRADGTDAVRVTDDAFVDWAPSWSADGRYLYFSSARAGTPNVWRIAIDEVSGRPRGEPEPVPLPARAVVHARLARDGSHIVYEAWENEANVYRVDFDGAAEHVTGEPVAVTRGTRGWEDIDIAPDGRLVLGAERPHRDLHIANADGSGLAALAPDPPIDRFPRWSPDGRHIAFSSMKSGNIEAWIIRADGSEPRQITFFEDRAAFFPLWNADGTRLAVTTGVPAGGTTFVVDATRPWAEQTPEPLPLPPGDPELRYRPWSWSPDGSRLAAYSQRGAGLAVYAFDTDSWELLTERGSKPRWLGDSRRLIYTDDGGLFLLDTESKRAREILRLRDASIEAPALGPADRSIYFVRERREGDVWMARLR